MGTAPASILRKIPDSGGAREPEETSAKDNPKEPAGPDSSKSTRSGKDVRSDKTSGHRKGSFAALYRRALEKNAGPVQEPEIPQEAPQGPSVRRTGSRSLPPKSAGHSRKKKENPSEAALLPLLESPAELSRKKDPAVSRTPREASARPSPALWGPLALTKEAPSPSVATRTKVMSPPAPPPSVEGPEERPLPEAFLSLSGESGKAASSSLSGKSQAMSAAGLKDLPKGEKDSSQKESRPSPDAITAGRPLLPEPGPLFGETRKPLEEIHSATGTGGFASQEKATPLTGTSSHGSGAHSDSAFQSMSSGVAEGAGAGVSVTGGMENSSASLPDGLSSRVGTMAREGGGQVALEVKPPHLGPVGVRVHVDPHSRLVRVELSSHDPQIRSLLSEKEGSIKESLSQSGYVLDRFQVVSQSPPGPDSASMQAMAGAGPGGTGAGSEGGSSSGDQGSLMAQGGSGGQDPGGQGRPEPGAAGREGNREGYSGASGGETPDPDRMAGGILPGEPEGEGAKSAGYHRIA